MLKKEFESQLKEFVLGLQEYISTEDGQWTIKGFIDVFQNIYTISSDTKIVSKILEIHLFPKIMEYKTPTISDNNLNFLISNPLN